MQTALDVGVDVSRKTVLVACAAHSFAPHALSNEAKVLRGWVKSVPAGSRVAVEATGCYHPVVADLAHAAGLTV